MYWVTCLFLIEWKLAFRCKDSYEALVVSNNLKRKRGCKSIRVVEKKPKHTKKRTVLVKTRHTSWSEMYEI